MNNISNGVKNIEVSGIRKFYNLVSKYNNVISLTLGQPDFNVHPSIKKGAIKALEENKTTYTSNAGILELRKEICNYLKSYNIKYNEQEICITIGGSEGIYSIFSTFINKDDVVLIPNIAYPAYESCAKIQEARVEYYKLNNNFNIDLKDLKRKLDKYNPKILVLSYPSNPTGGCLSKYERDELYKLIKNREIIVISDEIYCSIFYEEEYYSISQIEDIRHKVILISGFSKMFSMTGFRVGYICAKDEFMNNIMKVHQYNVSCAPSISQWAAYEGLKNKESMNYVEYMKKEFKRRRDYVCERLNTMGFDVKKPKGAFYVFPCFKNLNLTYSSEEFCKKLLEDQKVAVVPGSAFGMGGEGYFRLSYSYSMEEIKEGLDRIEKFLIHIL